MDKIDIRGMFNQVQEWEGYDFGGLKLQRRKKQTAQEVEEAAWEVAQYALIVDEEAGEVSERLDVEGILLWVLFKYASNVDMEVFGDIYTGLNEFIDSLPDTGRFEFINKYYDVEDMYGKIKDMVFEKVKTKNDLGKRLLKAFGGFLGEGSFTEEAAKAQQLSETLIDLIGKARAYDNITGAMGNKKHAPIMPEGVAKKPLQ